MNRNISVVVAVLTLLGGLVVAGTTVTAADDDGYAAFFWFDSQKISATGEPFYGAYAYRRLLSGFSPIARPTQDSFAYFDGDFLPQSPLAIPFQGPQESSIAEQARQLGGVAYVIAVYSYQAGPPFRDVDRMLRATGTAGYLGLTTRAPLNIDAFIRLTRQMSLPLAMKQEGARLRIADFSFISTADLRKMGFEPQAAGR